MCLGLGNDHYKTLTFETNDYDLGIRNLSVPVLKSSILSTKTRYFCRKIIIYVRFLNKVIVKILPFLVYRYKYLLSHHFLSNGTMILGFVRFPFYFDSSGSTFGLADEFRKRKSITTHRIF